MQRAMLGLRLLLVFLRPLTSVQLEEVEEVSVEVIVDSTPCSATCGLGTKTQTLCLLKDGRTALEEEGARQGDGGEVRGRGRGTGTERETEETLVTDSSIQGVAAVPGPQGEVPGVVAVQPHDLHRDLRTASGDGLSGGGHGGHGEVLLEVRREEVPPKAGLPVA